MRKATFLVTILSIGLLLAPLMAEAQNSPKRFMVLANFNNEAVLDLETKLVWEKSLGTDHFTWVGAQGYCNQLNVGNRLGWRLPTVQELVSLVAWTQANPSLPSGHPFTDNRLPTVNSYWSATPYPLLATTHAWNVDFDTGVVSYYDIGNVNFVWCVRGGLD